MPGVVLLREREPMPVTQAEFRRALRHFAAGVAVVTTRDDGGRPCALTASAFTSVSADPPLVLVCVDRAATAHAAVEHHGWFAVNVLAHGQESLSRQFAASGGDKFSGVPCREGLAGLPLLEGALTTLECRLVERHAGGDHTIFVGRVEGATTQGGVPLVYFQGEYHHLVPTGGKL
jgi:flavin reductase (DIM6/NTAB) family NADH-FMN oxidoreductase RutF